MKFVSRYEANLLRILHGILGQAPLSQVLPLLGQIPRPLCLSRDAVDLVQDALAKGLPLHLARLGGWRRERFLRDGQPREGRLWRRTPPADLGLSFTAYSMEYLLWLTSAKAREEKPKASNRPTLGDELLVALGFDTFARTEAAATCRVWPGLDGNGLCVLLYPDEILLAKELDWTPWLQEPGSSLLEALQTRLSERWLEMERGKAVIDDPGAMRRLGDAQQTVLTGFLDAADAAGRRDLARFLLATAAALLEDGPNARRWIGALDVGNLRLAERVHAYRAALAFVRILTRLNQWEQDARNVGYFEEGYHAAQLWKADWERFGGGDLYRRAAAILAEVEPLRP